MDERDATESKAGSPRRVVDPLAIAQQVLDKEIGALTELRAHLDRAAWQAAVEAILACPGMVMVTGAGTSSSIARRMAHLLTCSGAPAVFIDPGQAQHGYSAVIRPRDLVLAFSRGGETDEVNGLLRIARKRGAFVISVLENLASTMAGLSDHVLAVSVSPENDALGPIPLASTLVHAAVSDALVAAVLEQRGFDQGQFAEVHPGGAVGKRLRQGLAEPSDED